MSKIIGIVSWKIGDNSFGVTLPYIQYFNKFGNVCFLTPWVYDANIDLLVIPGGPDINPGRYGDVPSILAGRDCIHRDYFETTLLPKYIEEKVPIIGVCRGIQAIAVHYQARLHQHIYGHEMNDADKRWEEIHEIIVMESIRRTLLSDIKGKIKVNSMHHQSIERRSLPDCLEIVAWHPKCKYGGIEAIAHKELPIAGVQWHPEEMIDEPVAEAMINCLLEGKPIVQSVKKLETSLIM